MIFLRSSSSFSVLICCVSFSLGFLAFFRRLFVMVMCAEDSRFHVLAVDDSVLDRKLIERLLKCSSYQVTAVDSGTKALEFLGLSSDDDTDDEQRDSKPASVFPDNEIEVSLIITDYCMPGMTGYDLLKKIKESASLKNIPVVIMSSENVQSRINRCLEGGAEEFLLKPVQLADMDKLKPHIMKHKPNETQNNSTQRKSVEEIQSSDKSRLRCNAVGVAS